MAMLQESRLFPAEPRTRDIAQRLYQTVRSLPILCPHGHTQAGWFARNERFRSGDAVHQQITISIACCTARASRWRNSKLARAKFRIRAKCGGCLQKTIFYFAVRQPACGWTTHFRNFSGLRQDFPARMPTNPLTPSQRNWVAQTFAHACSTIAFRLKCWRRPILRWIPWRITKRFAIPIGRPGFCRRFVRIRLSIPISLVSLRTSKSWGH